MPYSLRPFETGDAPALAALTLEAIRSNGAQAYSPEQVEAWSSGHIDPARFVARAKDGHQIFVMADENGEPAAYALLEPDGHLDMLYCAPAHAGQGLASQLLGHAEKQAHRMGATRLHTEASELARTPFERAGYTLLERRDFELRGIMIHNYAMEKPLN
ncbi:MAG: GNAT family N-acetyltransferase [Pseudomonadota bacterium]